MVAHGAGISRNQGAQGSPELKRLVRDEVRQIELESVREVQASNQGLEGAGNSAGRGKLRIHAGYEPEGTRFPKTNGQKCLHHAMEVGSFQVWQKPTCPYPC